MTDYDVYTLQVFYSEEDNGYVAVVVGLGTKDYSVHVSAIGDDKYKAIAEVSKALKAWEEAND